MKTSAIHEKTLSTISNVDWYEPPSIKPEVKTNTHTLGTPERNDSMFWGEEINVSRSYSKRNYSVRETIDNWWIGNVIQVNSDEGYFTALLKDLKGVESVAEFETEKVFENEDDVHLKLFKGAKFAFFIVNEHRRRGNPISKAGIEFDTPYIWGSKDNDEVKKLYKELFTEDSHFID